MVNPHEIIAGATVAGYAVGHGVDYVAARWATRNVRSGLDIDMQIHESQLPVIDEDVRPTTSERLGSIVAKNVTALTLATAAGVNTYAYMPEVIEKTPPSIEVVVDNSGGTILADENGETAKARSSMVLELFDGPGFKGKAVVADSGQQATMDIDKAIAREPFGGAKLDSATKQALASASEAQKDSVDSRGKASAGVVVVTDGTNIGSAEEIIASAKHEVGSTSVTLPVSVVNISPNVSEETKKNLQTIAEKTNGKYWDVTTLDDKDVKAITPDLNELLSDGTNGEKPDTKDKLPVKILGGLMLAGTAALLASRRNYLVARGSEFNSVKKEK